MEVTTRDERDVALEPYLSILERLSEHREEATRVSTIHVGERTVDVEPWERTQVLGALNEPSEDDDAAWRRVLAHGVAYRTRCMVDLDEVEETAGEGAGASERLRRDLTLGLSLMEESQQAINLLVLGGKLEDAKNLTRFRHKIKRTLDDLKGRVDREVEHAGVEYADPAPVPESAEPDLRDEQVLDEAERARQEKAAVALAKESARLERKAERKGLRTPPHGEDPYVVAVGARRKRRWLTPVLLVILVVCGAVWAGLHFGYLEFDWLDLDWLDLEWLDLEWLPEWFR